MKYFIKTFGCQSNKSDSERIAGDYEARGWTEAKSWRTANNVIVNTCAIRQSAEDRATGFLLNVEKYFVNKYGKDKFTRRSLGVGGPKIILTGCMTHHGAEHIYELLPMVDEILPVGEVGFNQAAVRKDVGHAWVPISQGCNSFCTYCIVPYSRGREISRPMAEILSEVEGLAAKGYTEITLLGQNVNSWGLEKVGIGLRKFYMGKLSDLPSNESQYETVSGITPFVKLLRAVTTISGIKLVRFMTSNPWDFHDDLINEIASNPKIDKFIHLPVQSGSNSVLKRMNRGYTRESYLAIVRKLRDKVPNLEIGTDLIVGFCGETDAEFADTVALAREVGWKVGFVARYSPRPGTAAWRLYQDDVSPAVKKQRWQILENLINQPYLGTARPKVVK